MSLVLASGSPRRKELLGMIAPDFEVVVSEVDESAVRAASENPARCIGIDADYGSLAVGRYGNVVLADAGLGIRTVIKKGEALPQA